MAERTHDLFPFIINQPRDYAPEHEKEWHGEPKVSECFQLYENHFRELDCVPIKRREVQDYIDRGESAADSRGDARVESGGDGPKVTRSLQREVHGRTCKCIGKIGASRLKRDSYKSIRGELRSVVRANGRRQRAHTQPHDFSASPVDVLWIGRMMRGAGTCFHMLAKRNAESASCVRELLLKHRKHVPRAAV